MESFVRFVLVFAGTYLIVGALFSVVFLLKGKERIDESTKETSVWFKLLVFPGLCLFWIVFIKKWIKLTRS
jgi:hypothetical protein